MIGMIFDDIIYFKTDEATRTSFKSEKCKPFTFVKHKSGETVVTTWFALPDKLYDDPDELAEWARAAALTVARNAPGERKKRTAAKKKGAPTVEAAARPGYSFQITRYVPADPVAGSICRRISRQMRRTRHRRCAWRHRRGSAPGCADRR